MKKAQKIFHSAELPLVVLLVVIGIGFWSVSSFSPAKEMEISVVDSLETSKWASILATTLRSPVSYNDRDMTLSEYIAFAEQDEDRRMLWEHVIQNSIAGCFDSNDIWKLSVRYGSETDDKLWYGLLPQESNSVNLDPSCDESFEYTELVPRIWSKHPAEVTLVICEGGNKC